MKTLLKILQTLLKINNAILTTTIDYIKYYNQLDKKSKQEINFLLLCTLLLVIGSVYIEIFY